MERQDGKRKQQMAGTDQWTANMKPYARVEERKQKEESSNMSGYRGRRGEGKWV